MTIEKAMQLIKGGFAFRAGKELGFRAPVWQKGFSEIRITDAPAYLKDVRVHSHESCKAGVGCAAFRLCTFIRKRPA
jgi:hypothetical protein